MARRKKDPVPQANTSQRCKDPHVCSDCRDKLGMPPLDPADMPEPPTESMALGYIDSILDLTKRLQDYRTVNVKTEDKEFSEYLYELEYKLVVMMCTAADLIGPDTRDDDDDEEDENFEVPAN